ncbi:ATP-dependent helicase [Candidatus Woesearchaeota archaeon]|nr:ATP-dependent helicase [Candidatus Woesearchaeota archaeon]
MIEFIETPRKKDDVEKILHPFVKEWFFLKFKDFSLPQLYGVMEIHNGNNILVSAPTGATKTLTAFLAILNELVSLDAEGRLEDKIYCVYTSPLKALSNDIFVNLITPLEEINEVAKKHGKKLSIRVGLRTGDTTASERAKMIRNIPHILVTTPESLAIVLTAPKFREYLRNVRYCIIDEIHAIAENKRGVHLSLSIERLKELTENDFCRIGLSATISPLDEVAKYLVGSERSCKIADVQFIKKMDLKVLSPVKDLINTNYEEQSKAMYELIDNLVQEHKTALIFTNTRAATERVVHYLKERFPKKYSDNIGAHHGSLSKEKRLDLENRLRKGEIKVVVCSTSLELGIDIGYIDLVILLGSPKSVARCLQRIGRSGHKLHETSKGRIIVLDRDDLIECSVMLKSAIERKIDTIHIPKNCLDVLAQQIYGIAIADRISYDNLFKLIKRSYCYKNLDKKDFDSVLDYLSGEFTSLEDRHVYAKIWWDKETGMIGRKGKLSRIIYMTNIGTIPDETHVTVKVGEQVIGHIDEGFLEKLKSRDVFVLGGDRYEFQFARGMVAQVKSTIDRPPTIPSWFSEMLPLSFDLGVEIGRFRRLMEEKFAKGRSKEEIIKFVDEYLYVDRNSAEAIYRYFSEMFQYAREIPHDKKILIEHYNAYNKKFVVFHALYGRRVNDVLSRAVAYLVGLLGKRDVEIGINDNGFYLASEDNMQAKRAFDSLKSKDLDAIMEIALEKTEVLRRRFRHCAGRSLMILREYKGKRKRVGRQQVSSMLLISAVRRISNDFPILKETRREVLEDLMDIAHANEILVKVEKGEIKVKEIDTKIPSPFAFNLVLQGYVDVFKIEDRIEFLKRMHNLVLAKIGKTEKIEA